MASTPEFEPRSLWWKGGRGGRGLMLSALFSTLAPPMLEKMERLHKSRAENIRNRELTGGVADLNLSYFLTEAFDRGCWAEPLSWNYVLITLYRCKFHFENRIFQCFLPPSTSMPLWNSSQSSLNDRKKCRWYMICSSTGKQARCLLFFSCEGSEGSCITVRAWKTRENVERVWVGYFLSYGRLKIPSRINKPVPGSKVVGKWNEKKKRNFESWLTSEHFLLHQLHGVSF